MLDVRGKENTFWWKLEAAIHHRSTLAAAKGCKKRLIEARGRHLLYTGSWYRWEPSYIFRPAIDQGLFDVGSAIDQDLLVSYRPGSTIDQSFFEVEPAIYRGMLYTRICYKPGLICSRASYRPETTIDQDLFEVGPDID
ncbi:hypothetical protein J6590_092886 [Homalodisca vitripennis]|nr:hypothetical protein J6590_092886 [Homalodisca vitripennis]